MSAPLSRPLVVLSRDGRILRIDRTTDLTLESVSIEQAGPCPAVLRISVTAFDVEVENGPEDIVSETPR